MVFGISIIDTFYRHVETESWVASCKWIGKQEYPADNIPSPAVIRNFLTCQDRIRTRAVVRDSELSAMP